MNEKLCLYMPSFPSVKSCYEMVDIAVEYGLKYIERLNYFEFETPDKDFAVKLKEYADIAKNSRLSNASPYYN